MVSKVSLVVTTTKFMFEMHMHISYMAIMVHELDKITNSKLVKISCMLWLHLGLGLIEFAKTKINNRMQSSGQ